MPENPNGAAGTMSIYMAKGKDTEGGGLTENDLRHLARHAPSLIDRCAAVALFWGERSLEDDVALRRGRRKLFIYFQKIFEYGDHSWS